MNKRDVIFALVCGLAVSWIGTDFFSRIGEYPAWIFFIILPIISAITLWIFDIISRKYFFVKQLGKFVLAGAFADVVDIKSFQLVFEFLPYSLLVKAISFIVATFIKYYSDKYWTFEQTKRENQGREVTAFFMVAIGGMLINLVLFYLLGRINIGISAKLWMELSIILAAIGAGLWNFLGYKFLVFKK